MSGGIDSSELVIVFVTERYMKKVNGEGEKGSQDNCKLEFQYAIQKKKVDMCIAVVMEESMKNQDRWSGVFAFSGLGSSLYVGMWNDPINVSDLIKMINTKLTGKQPETPSKNCVQFTCICICLFIHL
jgi:hypothetical protein